jgi:type IV pilus modification protein PilV
MDRPVCVLSEDEAMIIRQTQLPAARHHAGFSMIDVLVAIVVLATGLLALAALQGALTRNSADARGRSQIASYSDGLIDQLRSGGFDNIVTATITPSCASAATKQQKEACNAQTAAGVSSLSTTITATTYYGDTTTGKFTTTAPTTIDATTPEYKQVDVKTTWTDASGQARTLALDTIVSPTQVDETNKSLVTKVLSPSTSNTPIVREYNPAATAGVIPIAIGTGTDTAATNPKPDLLALKGKNSTLVGTTFNVLTYQAPDNSNETVIQQRVENRVIRCSCKYGAGLTDTTDVFTQPYRPTYWNGTKYVLPTATTATFSDTGADSAASQDEFCDICCRDRNDTSADTIKFDPFATGSTPDYAHYRYDSTDTLVKVPSSDTTNAYLNACRLIRVDGEYRVATDMQNYFFGLLATEDQTAASAQNTSPIPDPTYVTKYQAFVTQYLSDSITSLAAGNGPESTATAQALYASSTYALDNPTNVLISYSTSSTDNRYTHARGLYIDHLESDALKAINDAISNCPGSSTTADCVLPLLPFTTINETELANWTVTPVKTGSATNLDNEIQVSDTFLIGGDPSTPLRGVVNALSSSTNGNVANAIATIGLSNSGVTGEDIADAAVDPDDKSTLNDSQQFTIAKSGSVSTVSWTVGFSGITELNSVSNISLDPSLLWSGTAAQLGTAGSGSCPGTLSKTKGSNPTYTPSYSCTTAVTTTPPVALSLTVQNFNQQTSVSQTVSGCGSANWPVTYCQNYAVNTSAITVNGTAVSGATVSLLSGTTDGGLQEGAVIAIPTPPGLGTNTTSPYDTVNIGFTLTSSTLVAGTCTSNTGKSGKTTYTYVAGTCSN